MEALRCRIAVGPPILVIGVEGFRPRLRQIVQQEFHVEGDRDHARAPFRLTRRRRRRAAALAEAACSGDDIAKSSGDAPGGHGHTARPSQDAAAIHHAEAQLAEVVFVEPRQVCRCPHPLSQHPGEHRRRAIGRQGAHDSLGGRLLRRVPTLERDIPLECLAPAQEAEHAGHLWLHDLRRCGRRQPRRGIVRGQRRCRLRHSQ
mmetsp:Transcript_128113/g.370870  ORF Transcript_128113/g.370870 Transcript_128113/m.370870 type:complete len:203 (+) Transcript_128113:1798-2406(+)